MACTRGGGRGAIQQEPDSAISASGHLGRAGCLRGDGELTPYQGPSFRSWPASGKGERVLEQSPACLSALSVRFLSSFNLPCPLVHKRQSQPIPLPGHSVTQEKWLCVLAGDCLLPRARHCPPHLKGCQLRREPCIWEGNKRLPDAECQDNSNTRSVPGRPGGSVRPRLCTAETASGKPDPPPPRAQPPRVSPLRRLSRGQRRVAVVEAVPMCELLPRASPMLTRAAGGAREPALTTRGLPHPPTGQRWQRPMWGCGTGLGHHTLRAAAPGVDPNMKSQARARRPLGSPCNASHGRGPWV